MILEIADGNKNCIMWFARWVTVCSDVLFVMIPAIYECHCTLTCSKPQAAGSSQLWFSSLFRCNLSFSKDYPMKQRAKVVLHRWDKEITFSIEGPVYEGFIRLPALDFQRFTTIAWIKLCHHFPTIKHNIMNIYKPNLINKACFYRYWRSENSLLQNEYGKL